MAISSTVAPTEAHAYRYSAWRSRAITWVAGTGVRPRAAQTWRSTAGSMLEYVPTAPDSLPTATASRARRSRVRSRSAWRHHSASLAPNVVGSAWMPWVRPTIGVCPVLEGPALQRADEPPPASTSRSAASVSIRSRAVSTTSVDVRP